MKTTTLSEVTGETSRVSQLSLPAIAPVLESPGGRASFNGEADAPPPKQNRSRSFKRLATMALIALAAVGVTKLATDWWTVGRFIESTDDAYVGGDVTVIAPEVAGFIAQVVVTDNQQVHAGDLLVKLDDRDYRAAFAKTDAAVAMQQAALVNLDALRHLQESIIAQAQAQTS